MNPKCNLTEEEREAAFRQFDGFLTEEEEDEVGRLFPQYLFFHNEFIEAQGIYPSEVVRVCTCTACKESFEATRGNYSRGKLHNEECNCPRCGEKVTGKAVTKFGYGMNSLEGWVKTAIARHGEDGALLIEAGNARRTFCHDDLIGTITWEPTRRYYLSSGKCCMWKKEISVYSCNRDERSYIWSAAEYITDPVPPNMMNYSMYNGDYSVIGLSAADGTSMRYSQIEDFYRYYFGCDLYNGDTARYIVKYLGWYALYPQIEMCVKFNLLDIVGELIVDGRKNARILDWSKTKIHEFLRLSKADTKLFLNSKTGLKSLRIYREKFKDISFAKFCELVKRVGGEAPLENLSVCAKLAGVSIEKAVKYIDKLTPLCPRAGVSSATIIQYWLDYLKMAAKLEYDMSEETVIMPKDLKERHDTAAAIIKHITSEDEAKKYKKLREKLRKKYAFELGELCVIIPESAEEIVREGQTLHHCVSGYAKRHIEGKTIILFLRKRRKPWRSFLTVEMYEERGKAFIRQVHGYKNERYDNKTGIAPSARYGEFLDTWLAWVNAGSKRDENGRAILPKTDKEKSA